ncbi:MAG: hypothetical protein C5B44_03985 [Acidobacteria bacterium]|nr:MAG: hypothetical protein C5B44_03985 [Acidobacteriota bacterium]
MFEHFICDFSSRYRHSVGIFERYLLFFSIQTARGILRQLVDLLIRYSKFAADRSVDVLSKLTSIQRCNATIDKGSQAWIDQTR